MAYTGIGQLSAGPKTPTELKIRNGTFNTTRDSGSVMMETIDSIPLPPDDFDDDQKNQWNLIINNLFNQGILYTVSIDFIKAYCIEWKIYHEAVKDILANGIIIKEEQTKGLFVRHVKKRNPAIDVSTAAWTKIMTIAGHFGFTPAAATRIKAPGRTQEVKDPDFNF